MKFLVDAQLPRRIADWLNAVGHDAVHTLNLPEQNRTTDIEITVLAESESRIVVTKDADFVNSHLIQGRPPQLLLISTGNITNSELERLLVPFIDQIAREFQTSSFLELCRTGLITRG